MSTKKAYEDLMKISREISYLGSMLALAHWDQRTEIPLKGHPHRAEVISYIAGNLHKMISDPRVGELLSTVEGSDHDSDPSSISSVNIRDWRRAHNRATKIPSDLAKELSLAAAEGESAWEKARKHDDWKTFAPFLERIVRLKREEAHAVGFDDEPYDALLDVYERGATAKELERIFTPLARNLRDLLERLQPGIQKSVIREEMGPFPISDQKSFALQVATDIGYDLDAGILKVSAHPFTSGLGPGDVRITTRYYEDSFNPAFFGVIHETGHALYHQGLPVEYYGLPFCGPISLGINESQSRLWENMVARSRSFWEHYFPKLQNTFAAVRNITLDEFYAAINRVGYSFIRVEADEVTYNLHILLRFEIELALIRGDIQTDDLPGIWNDKFKEYFGLQPSTYSEGVMQDVHWSGGSIGYFPTYTLGNLYAAQLFHKAASEIGDLDRMFRDGQFVTLLGWLRAKIHSQGRRFLPKDLMKQVTGEEPNPSYLMSYLNEKYGRLYSI